MAAQGQAGGAARSRRARSRQLGVWAAVACVACSVAAHADSLSARLTMVPIDLLTRVPISGAGTAAAELEGRVLTVEGRFAGMQGAATAVRLHEGTLTGVRGPAVFELEFDAAEQGAFSGQLDLSEAQAASVRAGRWYVQIHSTAAPDGNLWGWLLP